MKFLHLFVGDVKNKGCVDGLIKKYFVHKRASIIIGQNLSDTSKILHFTHSFYGYSTTKTHSILDITGAKDRPNTVCTRHVL